MRFMAQEEFNITRISCKIAFSTLEPQNTPFYTVHVHALYTFLYPCSFPSVFIFMEFPFLYVLSFVVFQYQTYFIFYSFSLVIRGKGHSRYADSENGVIMHSGERHGMLSEEKAQFSVRPKGYICTLKTFCFHQYSSK